MNDSRSSYLDEPLGRFLELVSEATPAPAGGAVAALAVALAAALCTMAARLSGSSMAAADALAGEAGELRDRAAALSQADAEAYGRVIEVRRRRGAAGEAELAAALSGAADVPLEIVEIASRVAAVAAELAEHGNPNLRGDAVSGALLAEAAARAAGLLVRMNLEVSPGDGRPARVESLLDETAAAVRRATAAVAGAAPPA